MNGDDGDLDVNRTVKLWWDTLEPTAAPRVADLAFFTSKAHALRVLGACPCLGVVAERDMEDYLRRLVDEGLR